MPHRRACPLVALPGQEPKIRCDSAQFRVNHGIVEQGQGHEGRIFPAVPFLHTAKRDTELCRTGLLCVVFKTQSIQRMGRKGLDYRETIANFQLHCFLLQARKKVTLQMVHINDRKILGLYLLRKCGKSLRIKVTKQSFPGGVS